MARTCVFCSSSTLSTGLHALARDLGRGIAEGGDELVYGGTMTGLMGEVATGARVAGGRVVGVVPATIAALGSVDRHCDEVVEVATLGERKTVMIADAARVVVLPGGIGTLDELLSVLTHRQLGEVSGDVEVVLLDPGGFWEPLHAMFARMLDHGTVRPTAIRLRTARSVEQALDATAGPDQTR